MIRFRIKLLHLKYWIFNRLKYFVDKHASWNYTYDSFYHTPKVVVAKQYIDFQRVVTQYTMPLREFDIIGAPSELLKSALHEELFHQLTETIRHSAKLKVTEQGGSKCFELISYIGYTN